MRLDRIQAILSTPRCAATAVLAGLLSLSALPAGAQTPFNFADFDDGFNANNVGGSWYYWDDSESGGDSRITSGDTSFTPTEFSDSSITTPGQGGTAHGGKMTWKYGAKKPSCGTGCTYDQEVGVGADMRTGSDTAADLTGATHISFWMKGSVAMKGRFTAATTDIIDYAFYGTAISVTTEWKEVKVDLKNATQFAQPSWATAKVPFNYAKVNGLQFSFSKADNASLAGGTFYIDGVQIHNWKIPDDPVAVRRAAASARARLLGITSAGLWRVALPATHRNGTVSAHTADGRVISTAVFSLAQATADLDLRGHNPAQAKIRIVTTP